MLTSAVMTISHRVALADIRVIPVDASNLGQAFGDPGSETGENCRSILSRNYRPNVAAELSPRSLRKWCCLWAALAVRRDRFSDKLRESVGE